MKKFSLILCLRFYVVRERILSFVGKLTSFEQRNGSYKEEERCLYETYFLYKQAWTYCVHPNSHATTVNLKPKRIVRLAILVSCRKWNVVLIIRVFYLVKQNFSVECHNLGVPGSDLGQGIGFSQFLLANAGIMPHNMPLPLHSTSFIFHNGTSYLIY
jgi:hypothetical protein